MTTAEAPKQATLAELIFRSQQGEEIEISIGVMTDKPHSGLGTKWVLLASYTSNNDFDMDMLNTSYTYRIKPRTVSITREQLAEAWDSEVAQPKSYVDTADVSSKFKHLCKRLGL